ncbi:hypothetical protein ES703_125194 [subsurface metagenome]
MNYEASYCTDGLGGTYLGGDSHGKHRPRLVGFWLVLDFLSHFASPGYVKSMLEMNGIKASLKDEGMGVIAPWYVTPGGVGAVKVVVLESQFEKAIQTMRSYSVWPTAPRSTLSRALRCCLVVLLLMILAIGAV